MNRNLSASEGALVIACLILGASLLGWSLALVGLFCLSSLIFSVTAEDHSEHAMALFLAAMAGSIYAADHFGFSLWLALTWVVFAALVRNTPKKEA